LQDLTEAAVSKQVGWVRQRQWLIARLANGRAEKWGFSANRLAVERP